MEPSRGQQELGRIDQRPHRSRLEILGRWLWLQCGQWVEEGVDCTAGLLVVAMVEAKTMPVAGRKEKEVGIKDV